MESSVGGKEPQHPEAESPQSTHCSEQHRPPPQAQASGDFLLLPLKCQGCGCSAVTVSS
jgi:hypothetical protein